jgi:hypothetical protein
MSDTVYAFSAGILLSVVVISTLTLAIGLHETVFSAIEAVLTAAAISWNISDICRV